MRQLCPHQLHWVGGARGRQVSGGGCPDCDAELEAAASQFADDYNAFQGRYDAVGFSDGAVIGSSIGAAVGGRLGGNLGSSAGALVGQYGGRVAQAGFPYGSYMDVKNAAEKIYGLQ